MDKSFKGGEMNGLDEICDLIKAGQGAGSRGGRVIGHTRSGKPIYASSGGNIKAHEGFSKEDHYDAYAAHAHHGTVGGRKASERSKDFHAKGANLSYRDRVMDRKKHLEHGKGVAGGASAPGMSRGAASRELADKSLDDLSDLVKAKYIKKIGTGKTARYIYKPGDVVKVRDRKGGGEHHVRVIHPEKGGGGFYYHHSDSKGNLPPDQKHWHDNTDTSGANFVNHSNMLFGGDHEKVGHKPMESKGSVGEHSWAKTGHKKIDDYMGNLDGRHKIFQKHATSRQKGVFTRNENANRHSRNGEMVGKFAEHMASGADPKEFRMKKSELDEMVDLVKGGEGSKGGNVIGHTSSGKPIYSASGNRGHKEFDHKDHHQAFIAHSRLASRKSEESHNLGNKDGTISHKDIAKKKKLQKEIEHHRKHGDMHMGRAEAHATVSGKKVPSYDQSVGKVKMAESHDQWTERTGARKSEQPMTDIFKSLGIRVGDDNQNLINNSSFQVIEKGGDDGTSRMGRPGNARDMLTHGLMKGGYTPDTSQARSPVVTLPVVAQSGDYSVPELKDGCGENWHTDNDKEVEELLNTVEEIDVHEHGEFPKETKVVDQRNRKVAGVRTGKSMSSEELFLKSFQEEEDLEKGYKGGYIKAKKEPKDPAEAKKEKQQREEMLANSLNELCDLQKGKEGMCGQTKSGKPIYTKGNRSLHANYEGDDHKDAASMHMNLAKIANKYGMKGGDHHRSQSMKHWEKYGSSKSLVIESDLMKGGPGSGRRRHKVGDKVLYGGTHHTVTKFETIQEQEAKNPKFSPNGASITLKHPKGGVIVTNPGSDPAFGKSILDEVVDLVKSGHTLPKSTPVRKSAPVNKGAHVIARGPGGVQFEFGMITGNPIADRGTAILNECQDPTQAGIAKGQRQAYKRALGEWCEKGAPMEGQTGQVNSEWADQFNTPVDEQMKKAQAAGALNENPYQSAPAGDGGTFENNRFSDTEIVVGGKVVKATSETDVAMIKAMQGNITAQSHGVIADLTGGGVIADLRSGVLTDANGRELAKANPSPIQNSPEPQGASTTLSAKSL